MPGKMARLDPRPALPEVLVAVSTSRRSCKRAGKTRTLTPIWDLTGESREDLEGFPHLGPRSLSGPTAGSGRRPRRLV